ncbi:MAG: hypothetical protein WBZ36_30145 [Candidatus Nitrosopolaris sp.]
MAKEDEIASLLMTIPGIGYYSALLIVNEIGDINSYNFIVSSVIIYTILPTLFSS